MGPKEAFGRLQDLIGRAKGLYGNDRDPNTADKILPVFKEAFDLCVEMRARWKP